MVEQVVKTSRKSL